MPITRASSLILAAHCCLSAVKSQAAEIEGKPPQQSQLVVAGWVENGWLGEPPVKFKVKLDTGAKTSSIHAAQYREYVRDGTKRVSFTLVNNQGDELKIDSPVLRTASIRRAGTEVSSRPVIRLKLCVAGVASSVEFTMTDRSELQYPVLVGRSFLAGNILVDSARTFQATKSCDAQ